MKKPRKISLGKQEEWRNKRAKHIVFEKEYTETCAVWMVKRIEALIDYMQYGHAVIAYYKQDGTFCLVRATLRHYETDFGQPYDADKMYTTLVYQDVELQRWNTFRIENFLEWKPVV